MFISPHNVSIHQIARKPATVLAGVAGVAGVAMLLFSGPPPQPPTSFSSTASAICPFDYMIDKTGKCVLLSSTKA